MIEIEENKNNLIEEKKNKFLQFLKQGYSRQRAFAMAQLEFIEWEEICKQGDIEKEMLTIEENYNKKLSQDRTKNSHIIYNPILDNYSNIDFENLSVVEKNIRMVAHYQTLAHPNNTNYMRNSIALLKIDSEARKTQSEPKVGNIVSFEQFVERANFPKPFPKQIEMVNFSNQPGIKLLLAARKYGKTDYLTILNTAYKMKTVPNFSCMIITKEESRGRAITRTIKQACIDNDVEFDVKASDELRVKGQFGKEASVIACPVGGTNYRGHHVDCIILDDPVVPADKTSPASRQRVIDLYNELVNLSSNILVIGQPVHRTDLYSVLKESSLDSDKVKCMEVPHGSIPELDTDLNLLRQQGVSEEAIGANYLLKLRSEGILPFYDCNISMDDKVFNPLNDDFAKYKTEMWIDPAKRETGRDYTAIAIAKITPDTVYCLGFAWKKPYNDLLEEIGYLDKRYQITRNRGRIYFEMNGLADDSMIRLKEWGIEAVPFNTKENKEKKISAMTYIAENIELCKFTGDELEYISPNKDFIKLFKEYEYGATDDPVDALASYLLEKGGITVEVGKSYKI